MATYTYTIDYVPPSNNEFIGRDNHIAYQKKKKEWADIIGWLCRPRPKKPIPYAKVTLRYYFPNRMRRDPDNYSGKFILDGLTKMGIIEDDSFYHIRLNLELGGIDTKHPHTEIVIEELDESEFLH
ncbi:MAG: RusA family crossover junction endodeoxyribonuclease [Oscillospiraceae bacterium]|nr:RusA family crossover junction endodeoxyribonuclease [Oscillospiraceae bacterium]